MNGEAVATKSDIATLRNELALAARDLKIWTGGTVAAGVIVLAAIKFFG